VGTAILYSLLAINAAVSFFRPWIGVVGAYLVAILAPQDIWWWLFSDLRPFFWVILPTLAGFGIAALRGQVDFAFFRTRVNACVAILWISAVLAYYFGPYVNVVNEWRFYDPQFMFGIFQKTYLTYFVGVALLNDSRKLKFGALVLVITTVYMTYWANAQYFLYHKYGRLHGPTTLSGTGIYADENNFAVLFVVGFPFLYYFGQYLKSRLLQWSLWPVILFSWHAVFLTASRGALLGIGSVLLLFSLRLERKTFGILIIAAFVGAFVWQAGDVMKSRSATITDYEEEDSAMGRIEAWEASSGMMAAHPLTGVGFASFGQAFPDFSDKRPRVAHNTFFQIGGEWGVIAGITYLTLLFSTINRLRKNGNRLRQLARQTDNPGNENRLYLCINEACLLGLTGFFVCSMFLSLQGYEVFYYLLVLANATLVCSSLRSEPAAAAAANARPRLPLALRGRAQPALEKKLLPGIRP